MKIVIVAGGTGGHIYPGIALADEIKARQVGAEIIFLGGKEGLEKEIVPRAGYPLKLIAARALLRKISYKAITAPLVCLFGFFQALFFFIHFSPDKVICTGGYVSLPAGAAALALGKKLYLLEQNVPLGLTNRLFGRWAKKVFLSFAESLAYSSGRVVGNPIRRSVMLADRNQSRLRYGFTEKEVLLLVTGGSQGARKINEVILKVLPKIIDDRLRIIHVIGERDRPLVEAELAGKKFPFYRHYGYLHHMAEVLAAADLVVSRAGATAIAEFLARGLPMILVPFPFSAERHQELNAEVVARAGAAIVIGNGELNPEKLILALGQVKSRLSEMKEDCQKLARPNAAREIINEILA